MRSIPPVLLSKIKNQNQTIWNNAQPKMKISVSRAKNTVMDSTYWTVETIRQTTGLGDVSVAPRRFKPYGRPNRIYEIHVKDGEVITSIREYPDKLKEGFKNQFSLGLGTSVAVAFNGEWKMYRKTYRLVTDESPWISWVDNNGDLWVQLWDDASTRLQLSSNVVKVRMIRAWKNTAIHYLDQGIVAAYIKTDGKVYYRNYCIQENYTEVWEHEKKLTGFTGTAVNVNLFITNDYRMGFIIEDNTIAIHWLVTHRNWGGMASPAESIISSIKDITLEVIPIKYYDTMADDEHISISISGIELNVCPFDFDISQVTIMSAKRIGNNKIGLVFSHNILNAEQSIEYFTIENKTLLSVEYGNSDKEILLNTVESLPSVGVYSITYEGELLRVMVTSCCKLKLPSFMVDATGDPPVYEEKISVSIIPALSVTQVYYTSAQNYSENINVSVGNIIIAVTKVGNNPL